MNTNKDYKDFYDLFGLPTNAKEDEINQRTKSMIKKFHPDVADDEIAATPKQFKTLNLARDTLKNEDKREKYDDMGHSAYMDKYCERDDLGFSFEETRSIENANINNVDDKDVNELIKNDLESIHKSKDKQIKKEMNRTKNNSDNNSPKNIDYTKENNSTDSVGILISLGRLLKSSVFKYTIIFIFFVMLQVMTYMLLGLLATIFVLFLSLILIIVVRKI